MLRKTILILLMMSMLWVYSASAQTAATFDCEQVSEVSTADCEALVSLYTAADGDNWLDNTGWMTGNPCDWVGVRCANERVSHLYLSDNNLVGALPSELSDLTALTWLQLHSNQLTGAIPATLGNLDQVVWLRLENNQLTGNIPSQLGDMTALENLYLAGNLLDGALPAALGNLANLQKLYLDDTAVSGTLPAALGNLTQLRAFTLGNTNLSGAIPLSFVNLSNLTYFHLLGTAICEPADAAFQAWRNQVENVYSLNTPCANETLPSPTPYPTAQATAQATAMPQPTATEQPPCATPHADPTPYPTAVPTEIAPTTAAPTSVPPTTGTDLCAGLIIDQAPHPMQPLAKPGYLQTVTDPAFGTTIRRITDIEATVTGEQAVIKPMYNTVQAWNADETYMILYQRSAGHQLLDGITYQPIRSLDIRPADIEEVFWHFSDPDIFYYVEPYYINESEPGQRLIRYHVSTDTKEVVRAFTDVCGRDEGVQSGNDVQMMSWDSDVIGLRCGEPAKFFNYRISTDTVSSIIVSGQGNDFYPWYAPQAAPSGNLFHLGDTVFDGDLNVVRTLNMSSPEHATLGQFRDGTDGLFTVAFADGSAGGCGNGSLIAHDLTDGSCRTLVGMENGYPYPPSDTHHSALSHLNPGWVAVSGVGVANWGQTNDAGQALLDNELLLVDSDDGQVCRIGHHRSFAGGGSFDYWAEPHVVISPSGTRILFGSDWEGGTSVDAYVVELPSYTAETVSATDADTAVPLAVDSSDIATAAGETGSVLLNWATALLGLTVAILGRTTIG